MSKINQQSDRYLMTCIAQEKDRQAWQTLYERHANRLFSYFMRLLKGNKAFAEDMLQETFIKVFEKAWQYNPDYAFSTWLFSIGSNTLKNEWKRESKKDDFPIEESDFVSSTVSPEESSDQLIIKDQIETILDTVSKEHKETYVLRYQQGFSTKEVAEVLNISDGTVKSRLFKVTQLISKHFQSHKSIKS